MKRTLYNKIFSFGLIISLFVFASCEIGLGSAVDMVGPTVEITSPFPRENVMGTFNITGTVFDDTDISSITVTCGGNEWKNEGGQWKVKLENSDTWQLDTESTWKVQSNGKKVEWEIKDIDFSAKDADDYEIIVSSVDGSGNTSGESRKTRTVVVDKTAPVVTVSSPIYKQSVSDFDSLSDYKDITKIGNFVTNDFTIAGTTTDENTILYVDVYLVDKSCNDLSDSNKIYYSIRMYQDEANKNGENAPVATLPLDSLRAWECPVNISDWSKLKDLYNKGDKQILKILTKTKDASGNTDNITSHGFICLWKNADKPWLNLNLGTDSTPLSVYAGSSLLGNAYDDTCVSKVYLTIKESSNTGAFVQDENGDTYNKKVIYTGTEENNVFFNVTTPKDCKKYYIEIKAEDNKGNQAVPIIGYIKVEDKTYPSIEIKHEVNGTEKSNGETLFGSEIGDFKFVITAKDDTQVKNLLIAYMTNEIDIVEYSNKDYGKGTSTTGWGKLGSVNTDLKDKKVISLPITDTGTTVTENGIKKKVYNAECELNIFTDLGVDGSSDHRHSNQTFVFRVEDGNGNSITKDYTILGDIETPEIVFEKIEYTHGGKKNTYTDSTELLPAFQTGDSVKVYGKIRDNAIDNWNWETISSKWHLGKNDSLFKVQCNDVEIIPTISSTKKLYNGQYYYEWTATKESLKGSSLVYKATLKDLNGNEAIQNYAFLVDTQTPKVEYIYTSVADGCYGVDKEIPILIRFNKQLKFAKKDNLSPTIMLNNGSILKMEDISSSGEREFKFIYKVKDTDSEVEILNVSQRNGNGINLQGGKIKDLNGIDITSQIVELINNATKTDSGINLKDKKKITIISSPLAIIENGINLTESGDVTTVELTYNRNVSKGSGEIKITQQNVLNVPPVLSETDYKKYTAIQDYYELTTNGASSTFVADLTPKYVLKYEYVAIREKGDALLTKYLSTNRHILSQNVKSNKVTVNGNKVTIKLGKLPVKGAEYLIEIPEGFVQDAKGGSAFPGQVKNTTKTSSGIETPIIRIQKNDATIEPSGDGFIAKQPMTAKFKVDCETPGVSLNASYVQEKYGERRFKENKFGNKPNAVSSQQNNLGSVEQTIGNNIDYKNGLIYKIIATATKDSKSEKGYALAQRTTINISNTKFNYRSGNMNNSSTYWPQVDKDSKKIGLFLRGGDNLTGGNTTPGLPTSWDPKEYDKALLFTEDNGYYIVSWKITNNLYFLPLAGQMDSETYSGGIYKGPKYTCNAQNGFITVYSKFYAEPGSYTVIENTNCGDNQDIQFEVKDHGKAQMVR